MFHYGFLKTVDTFEEYAKDLDDVKKRLEQAEGDTTWQGVSLHLLQFMGDGFGPGGKGMDILTKLSCLDNDGTEDGGLY